MAISIGALLQTGQEKQCLICRTLSRLRFTLVAQPADAAATAALKEALPSMNAIRPRVMVFEVAVTLSITR